jgi:hypothetical protein
MNDDRKYSFRHVGRTMYELLEDNAVYLCVQVNNINHVTIDKYRTTRMSKQTTTIKSFARFPDNAIDSDDWFAFFDAESDAMFPLALELRNALTQMAIHYNSYLAQLIME